MGTVAKPQSTRRHSNARVSSFMRMYKYIHFFVMYQEAVSNTNVVLRGKHYLHGMVWEFSVILYLGESIWFESLGVHGRKMKLAQRQWVSASTLSQRTRSLQWLLSFSHHCSPWRMDRVAMLTLLTDLRPHGSGAQWWAGPTVGDLVHPPSKV
jgi:hypothetical protein